MSAPIAEAVARDLADPKTYRRIAASHGITPARHAIEQPRESETPPLWVYVLLAVLGVACIVAVVIA